MQFKKFLHLLILCTIFILPQLCDAQRVTQNRHGERIVIFPNGKWEYFDEEKPLHRAILKDNLDKESPEGIDIGEYSSKGDSDTLLDYQVLLEEAEEELAVAEEKESDAKFSKLLLEEELEEQLKDVSVPENDILELKGQIKLADQKEKFAKKERKKAAKQLKKLKKNKGKVKAKPKKKKPKKTRVAKNQKEVDKEEEAYMQNYRDDPTFFAASKRFKKYKVEEDVMYNPPPADCDISFEGVDEFLGKKRKDVARTVFFTHTDDDMRRYMPTEDYIKCEGGLTQIKGGVLLLNLFISVKTTDAKRAFGQIGKGGLISIKMLDGSKVTLANNKSDDGIFDALTGRHTFTTQYLINAGQEKKLKNAEVDMIRIIWETGYEDYEVYNIDFFRDQFRCLNK